MENHNLKKIILFFLNWSFKITVVLFLCIHIFNILNKSSTMDERAMKYIQSQQYVTNAKCIKVDSSFILKGGIRNNLNIDGQYYSYYHIKFHPEFPISMKINRFHEILDKTPNKCISGQYFLIDTPLFYKYEPHIYIYDVDV